MPLRTALLVLAALPSLAACGYSGEELANATRHTCDAQRIEREMAVRPEARDSLLAEFQTRLRYFDIIADGARSPEALREAVRDVTCE